MDQLHTSDAMNLPPLDLPYICENEPICPSHLFFQWPKARGWDSGSAPPLRVFASQMQSWLFIGLIFAFFGENAEIFLGANDAGQTVIDTDSICRLIFDPSRRISQNSELSRHSVEKLEGEEDEEDTRPLLPDGHDNGELGYRTVQQGVNNVLKQRICPPPLVESGSSESSSLEPKYLLLQHAVEVMNNTVIPVLIYRENDEGEEDRDLWTSEAHRVLFWIDILIDMLYVSIPPPPKKCSRRSMAAEVEEVRNSVARTGRCRSLGWRLHLTSLNWHELLSHPSVGNIQNHKSCSVTKCFRHNIDISTYSTQHVVTCDGCEFVDADQEVMKECIADDRIPLVHCYKNSKGEIQIKSVTGTLSSDYTAISHVWSGGLGNFRRNALPRCQLIHLMDIIKGIPETSNRSFKRTLWADVLDIIISEFGLSLPFSQRNRQVLFWLDTLCIPVAAELKPYRKKAIDSMAQIYAGAGRVLVLDPDLQQLPSELVRDDVRALALNIRTSPWMSRSWPLQEAAVASKLFFQLRDRSVVLAHNVLGDDDGPTNKDVGLPLSHFLDKHEEGHTRTDSTYKLLKFSDVWNALLRRSTTEQSDVHGIFAALVDLSAGEILSLPENERMKAIIKSQNRIPLSIMFQPSASSGLQNGNATWIPQLPGSDPTTGCISNLNGVVAVTPAGLLLEDAADTFALITRSDLPPEDCFVLGDGHDRYQIQLIGAARKTNMTCRNPSFLFILSKSCSEAGLGNEGACFHIQDLSDAGVIVRFECTLTWMGLQPDRSHELHHTCELMKRFSDPTYEVLIDVDIASWYMPKWSRSVAFPFSIIDADYAVTWQQSVALAYIITWWIIPIFATRKIDEGNIFWRAFASCTKTNLICVGVSFFRFLFLIPELSFWDRWLARFTQLRWAASFYESDMAKELLITQDPSIFITLPSHGIWFAIAVINLVIWGFNPQEWLLWVAALLITEPAIRLLLELLARRYKATLRVLWGSVTLDWAVMTIIFASLCGWAYSFILVGSEFHIDWMVWLGIFIIIVSLIWLWIDWRRGYSRRIATWYRNKIIKIQNGEN